MSSSSPRCHFIGRSDVRRSARTFPSRSPLTSNSTRWRHASRKTGIIAALMARQILAAGTRPVDSFQRWRTTACHGSGLHGPVDASSMGLGKCSSRAAESSGFSSCGLYPFARQAVHARCRSDSCSVKSTSSPFGPGRKNSSNLAPRARRARAATSCFRIVPR